MMVYMIEDTVMNLPFLMIKQIKIAIGKVRSQVCMPYGMIFTLIFMKAGIDLEGKDCKTLKYTNFYNIHTLHRTKFRKEGDIWVREIKGAQPDASRSSSFSPSNSVESCSPRPVVGSSFLAPASTSRLVAREHHPGPSISPHTLAMTHTFSTEGIINLIMDRMGSMLANLKYHILKGHDTLLEDTQR